MIRENHNHILIIDPIDNSVLRVSLEKEYGFRVSYLSPEQITVDVVQEIEPDLIILNVNSTPAKAVSFLSILMAQKITLPVVLIGTNGETTSLDLDYPYIIGWIIQSFTVSELALLIQTALNQPFPASELILAKRVELVDANRRLTRRVQELQTLFEIGQSVTAELDLTLVLHWVTEAAVKLSGADESYLLLADKSSENLYLQAQSTQIVEQPDHILEEIKTPFAEQVMQTGQAVTVSQHDCNLELDNGLPVYSLVNVPISIRQSVIGVLGVHNCQQQRMLTKDDEGLLLALASWAAIAIQNARLYADTKQLGRDLKLVHEVSRLVSGTLDVHQIPRLLLQRTAEIVGAECGSLALIDQKQNSIVFQLAYDGQGNEIKGLRNFLMPLGTGIAGRVAQTGQPIIANNAQNHPAWSPLSDQMTGFITKKLIAVPLIAEGEILGVVELLNKKVGEFIQNDVQLLSLVASSTAGAIRNAQQYTALKRTNRALQEAHKQRVAAERWTVLGKATASLAHRINNSTALVPIAAQHLSELLEQIDMTPELRRKVDSNLDRIRRNSLYTVELAATLLRRFRENPTEAYNINTLVEQALKVVEIPENIKVLCHFDPDLPEVDTSELLTDVLVELISNAVRLMASRDGLLRIATFRVGNDSVSIQITDNGPGIAEKNLERVFDMFYTTTPTGLGFGLWWIKTFLEQQHGNISVESCPHQNTTFTITLPRNLPPLHS